MKDAVAFILLLLWGCSVQAAPPVLDWIFPAGGQTNSSFEVTIGGKADPWPVQAWSDHPGIQIKPAEKANTLQIRVGGDVPIGPRLVRLFNEEGASKVRILQVGRSEESAEKEPNDNYSSPQEIPRLPAVINGKLDKSGDTDTYKVHLKAGSWIVAQLDGYGLGSPVDPLIHLLDAAGERVALAHDTANLDPLLAHRVSANGTYFIQVAGFGHPPEANVQFTGSAKCIYRLTLTDGPYAHYVFPPTVTTNQDCVLKAYGWNFQPFELPRQECIDGDASDGRFMNRIFVADSAWTGVLEQEPNHSTNQAQLIKIPSVVSGRMQAAHDQDLFAFDAHKQASLVFALKSVVFGSIMDSRLQILSGEGKEIARNDDVGVDRDPKLEWSSPAEGRYFVRVSDIFHKGAEDYVYSLEVRERDPDFRATAESDAIVIEPGKTAELKLKIQVYEGLNEKLTVSCSDLPSTIKLKNPEIPEKAREHTLHFVSEPAAQPLNRSIVLRIESKSKSHPILFDLRAGDTGGAFLVSETERLWLTVLKSKSKK